MNEWSRRITKTAINEAENSSVFIISVFVILQLGGWVMAQHNVICMLEEGMIKRSLPRLPFHVSFAFPLKFTQTGGKNRKKTQNK